jgi:uncharacterized membrane protein
MNNLSDTFRSLMKISGKILFVIGLVLSICMLFFGFWPSFVYILIMLAGAWLVFINKDTDNSQFVDTEASWFKKSYNTLAASIRKTDMRSAKRLIGAAMVTILAIFILIISALVMAQDYFKERDTINSSKEITAALDHYKASENTYPSSLSTLIIHNPLLSAQDRWGNLYQYSTQDKGAHFILISSGKDGKFNTRDDLVFKN